jgi:hypothetical protein
VDCFSFYRRQVTGFFAPLRREFGDPVCEDSSTGFSKSTGGIAIVANV